MGLLSWWKGKGSSPPQPAAAKKRGASQVAVAKLETGAADGPGGMNGAEEVRRPADVTVFEFGSTAAAGERVTLAGYCPVSDELEPCRWELVPAAGSDAPQFRIVF